MRTLQKLIPAVVVGLVLVLPGAVARADERRMFVNLSDIAWTLELFPRDQKEVGNMYFVLDGKETVLGEKGPEKSILLPAHSQTEVEFTHTLGAFYHAFELTSAEGRWARFTADHPAFVASLKKRPKVELGQLSPEGTAPAGYLASLAPFLAINTPVTGDLTILPSEGQPKQSIRGYKVINRTGDNAWRFAPAILQDSPVKKRGILMVENDKGEKVDLLTLGDRRVPIGGQLRFWLATDHDGAVAQTLKLSNPRYGDYVVVVTNVPGKAYPEDVAIRQIQGATVKPWVYFKRFLVDGYLEIEDPDQEQALGVDEK